MLWGTIPPSSSCEGHLCMCNICSTPFWTKRQSLSKFNHSSYQRQHLCLRFCGKHQLCVNDYCLFFLSFWAIFTCYACICWNWCSRKSPKHRIKAIILSAAMEAGALMVFRSTRARIYAVSLANLMKARHCVLHLPKDWSMIWMSTLNSKKVKIFWLRDGGSGKELIQAVFYFVTLDYSSRLCLNLSCTDRLNSLLAS